MTGRNQGSIWEQFDNFFFFFLHRMFRFNIDEFAKKSIPPLVTRNITIAAFTFTVDAIFFNTIQFSQFFRHKGYEKV